MKPIETLLNQFKDHIWNDRDDPWRTAEEIKELFLKEIEDADMPKQSKNELKKKVAEL